MKPFSEKAAIWQWDKWAGLRREVIWWFTDIKVSQLSISRQNGARYFFTIAPNPLSWSSYISSNRGQLNECIRLIVIHIITSVKASGPWRQYFQQVSYVFSSSLRCAAPFPSLLLPHRPQSRCGSDPPFRMDEIMSYFTMTSFIIQSSNSKYWKKFQGYLISSSLSSISLDCQR